MLNRNRALKVITIICFISMATAASVFAKSASGKSELENYTAIQTLLAKDTFAGVSEAAKKLNTEAKSNRHAELAKEAAKLSDAKDLASARAQFVAVSNQILPIAKAEKDKNFEVVYCPMKKARWVQKNGPIANPYYGSEMLECGVKEK